MLLITVVLGDNWRASTMAALTVICNPSRSLSNTAKLYAQTSLRNFCASEVSTVQFVQDFSSTTAKDLDFRYN